MNFGKFQGSLLQLARNTGLRGYRHQQAETLSGWTAAGRSPDGSALRAERKPGIGKREADTMQGSSRSGFLLTPVERKTGLTLSAYLKDRTKETTGAAIVSLLCPLRARTHIRMACCVKPTETAPGHSPT